MRPAQNLVGQKFGRLTVIGEYKPGRKAIKDSDRFYARVYPSVLCECDCGKTKRISVDNLRKGSTTSCGCFRSESSSERFVTIGKNSGKKRRKYLPVESSARDLYRKYMKRNPGDLSFEKFYELTQQSCYYCNSEPSQKYLVENATDNMNAVFIYNGLDRINNSEGYNENNVRPCCGTCNYMRHTLSLEGFYGHIVKISNNRQEEIKALVG